MSENTKKNKKNTKATLVDVLKEGEGQEVYRLPDTNKPPDKAPDTKEDPRFYDKPVSVCLRAGKVPATVLYGFTAGKAAYYLFMALCFGVMRNGTRTFLKLPALTEHVVALSGCKPHSLTPYLGPSGFSGPKEGSRVYPENRHAKVQYVGSGYEYPTVGGLIITGFKYDGTAYTRDMLDSCDPAYVLPYAGSVETP